MHYVIHDASLIIIQDTYVGERVIKTRPWDLDPGHSRMQLWEKKKKVNLLPKIRPRRMTLALWIQICPFGGGWSHLCHFQTEQFK